MTAIVLVHGGWHGGWAWREVEDLLRARGHRVFSPTMTGLGERAHLAHADITPDLHVEDIVGVLRANELTDVTLVGHSYGGFIIAGVASRMPDRVSALVYLDAFVPTASGQSAFSIGTPERAAEVRASMTGGYLVPPTGFDRWTADPDKRAWLASRTTPHPIRCFSEGPTLTGAERTIARKMHIICTRHRPSPFWAFDDRYADDPGWETARLDCLHDAMVELPEATADLIDHMTRPAS